MKKAIIIGASSGIGKQLAKVLSENGYILGLSARRVELLAELKKNPPCQCYIHYMDITNTREAASALSDMIAEMGGIDLIVISAGVGYVNQELRLDLEEDTVMTNVIGFTAIINAALMYFMNKGEGHIAAISSVAAIRGGADGPAYYASKAYISNYLEGVRCKVMKENMNISVTDIRPGLVDTAMAKGEGLFWVMPLEKAAKQIYKAICKRKAIVYVTKRWGLIAFVLRIMPIWLYSKL